MRALIALLLLFWLLPAQAVIETYEFDSPQTEADYKRLIDELRCLVCQNQNLSDSDAELARDLRRAVQDQHLPVVAWSFRAVTHRAGDVRAPPARGRRPGRG